MAKANQGDTVKVHYTGRLGDGTVFDSSKNREPIEFKIGAGQVIAGFEQAVIGMEPGASKTTTIPAVQAYGHRNQEMEIEVDRNRFPANIQPEIGQRYEIGQPDGRTVMVTVTKITDSNVILDANPPLAGKDLTFDIELTAIL